MLVQYVAGISLARIAEALARQLDGGVRLEALDGRQADSPLLYLDAPRDDELLGKVFVESQVLLSDLPVRPLQQLRNLGPAVFFLLQAQSADDVVIVSLLKTRCDGAAACFSPAVLRFC